MTNTQGEQGAGRGQEEPVGSLAEEAAKLFQVLQGASREHAAGASGFADAAGSLWHDLNDHVAGENCRYCPVCQLIGVLREPEVRGHLTSAARSLAAALASALATGAPDQEPGKPSGPKSADDEDA